MRSLSIGTRRSELARWQALWVRDGLLRQDPGLKVELVDLDTHGDRDLVSPLPLLDGVGVFTLELERRLLDGSIDLAVHSLKDMPTELPEGLEIGAFCQREDPRDVFLGKEGLSLAELPAGACVGTSSLRRSAQLLRFRPDLECVSIRGNLATRYRKLQEDPSLSGIVLAAAGVLRLGWRDRITEFLPTDMLMPAVGQGVVAVELASARSDVKALVSGVGDADTARAAIAERSFLRELGGGCQIPIGGLAACRAGGVSLKGRVVSLDGSRAVCVEHAGKDPLLVGRQAAKQALRRGAADILAQAEPN